MHLNVNLDLYDPGSPCHSVHIRNKTAVGARLALGTLALGYNNDNIGNSNSNSISTRGIATTSSKTVAYTGPIPQSIVQHELQHIIIDYGDSATNGLSFRSVANMTFPGSSHCNFEVTFEPFPSSAANLNDASWSGWQPVQYAGVVSGTTVALTLKSGSNPVGNVAGIRYAPPAFQNYYLGN